MLYILKKNGELYRASQSLRMIQLMAQQCKEEGSKVTVIESYPSGREEDITDQIC